MCNSEKKIQNCENKVVNYEISYSYLFSMVETKNLIKLRDINSELRDVNFQKNFF